MIFMLKQTAKWCASLLPQQFYLRVRQQYRQLRDRRALGGAMRRDLQRYRRHSGLLDGLGQAALQAHIIKSYHRIEKALALPAPRPGFGAHAVGLLLEELAVYLNRYGADHCVHAALNTLDEYVAFCETHAAPVPAVATRTAQLRARAGHAGVLAEGGTRLVAPEDIRAAIPGDMAAFFRMRFSVRQFSPRRVDMALIEQAVAMAQKTPSVCNRESGHVYVVQDRSRIDALLAFQNGNRGFGHQADKLLIVSSRLPCFHTVGERYQHWIDGGMYAMSLVYALHAQGLGVCCLNWSVTPDEDRALKAAAAIPDTDSIIMFLAVGHLPDVPFRVAQSPRRPFADVMTVL